MRYRQSISRRVLLISLFAIGYSLLAIPAFAHGNAFFEFNPDSFSNGSVLISQTGEVYQLFIPQNDFLGGIDLWFSNAGQSSPASLYLYNPSGGLLTSKSITVPAIQYSDSGQKVHIDFSSQFAVNSTGIYSLKIQSSDPNLRLYYAPRVKVLQHNAPIASQYQNGVAKISGQEQNFSFKFGLYETTESVPPVISNLSAISTVPYEALVSFNANEPADFKIDYGPQGQGYTQTSQYSGAYTFCASGVDVCRKTLATVDSTTYEFRLTVKDIWGNQSTATGTFTTSGESTPTSTPTPTESSASPTPTPDTIPPVISGLRIISLTKTRIQVAWSTNEAANSSYLISLMPLLTTVAAGSDGTFELEHFVDSGEVLSFGAGVQYRIRVTSVDLANNAASQSITFTTPNQTPAPTASPAPPTPSSAPQVQTKPDNTTEIVWPTPDEEPAGGYRIDFLDSSGKLVYTEKVPAGTHQMIANLADGRYTAIVYASQSGAFRKVSSPAAIKVDTRSFWEKLLSPAGIFSMLGIILLIIAITVIVLKRHDTKAIPA